MDELLNQFNISFSEDFSVVTYVINILICAVILSILSVIYIRFGRAISNRSQLSRVLIIVGLTTFIIISIVKSSLALSLGLVGALSIIRFRTAIKEPEELGYFFIAIAIGLGLGANQLFPTLIGFAILVVVIMITHRTMFKKSYTQNLIVGVQCSEEEKSKYTDAISSAVSSVANQVDLKRMKYGKDGLHFNFLINVSSLDEIIKLNDTLSNIDNSMDITFLDNEL